jgi:hypothetical protein
LRTRGKKTKDKDGGQAKESELFQQIGQQQMQLQLGLAMSDLTCLL